MIEEDAIHNVSIEHNITPDEIHAAIKIYNLYSREMQKLKTQRKLEREKSLRKLKIQEAKAKLPNRCFCVDEGYDYSIHDTNTDEIIRYFKGFNWYNPNECMIPVYKCSQCGKEYTIEVAIA
jgi:hypothetical protein